MCNELERKVNSTTDVQEACQLGYQAGYKDGHKAALDEVIRMLKRKFGNGNADCQWK